MSRFTGFTLTEVLVAIVVGLLVLTGVHRIFVAGLKTQSTTSLQTEVNRKAQVAMDDLISRLRGSSGVVDAYPDRIWFVDQDDQNVRFWVSEGMLYRYCAPDPGGYSGGVLLASSLSHIGFEYYDSDGQPATDAGEAVEVVAELEVAQAAHSARLKSAVRLRNK